jgi:hypothetical protein
VVTLVEQAARMLLDGSRRECVHHGVMPDDQIPRWRAETEADFGLFSAAEAARRAGSRGHSRSAAVRRWVETGKVFSVSSAAGLEVYPGFCFGADGRPHPAVAAVVKAFGGRLNGWELAGWFLTPNPLLVGRRPVDCFDQPDALLAAALDA